MQAYAYDGTCRSFSKKVSSQLTGASRRPYRNLTHPGREQIASRSDRRGQRGRGPHPSWSRRPTGPAESVDRAADQSRASSGRRWTAQPRRSPDGARSMRRAADAAARQTPRTPEPAPPTSCRLGVTTLDSASPPCFSVIGITLGSNFAAVDQHRPGGERRRIVHSGHRVIEFLLDIVDAQATEAPLSPHHAKPADRPTVVRAGMPSSKPTDRRRPYAAPEAECRSKDNSDDGDRSLIEEIGRRRRDPPAGTRP
ncbi:hypothetical protein UA74_10340 [Actinoalloteichus fjordicus]|uniref:Uncharacterized protein n=1 Tax=Actinoalloteichus fjordicus TaxID=1612552 RepID=A0AAC9LAS7_9PSEU|nr:hypothetical protein UA74_10340 [Actinoalloteichus fjordicus]